MTFSVSRPPNRGEGCPVFSLLNALYPYVCCQCVAMGLVFPLIPKEYHPRNFLKRKEKAKNFG